MDILVLEKENERLTKTLGSTRDLISIGNEEFMQTDMQAKSQMIKELEDRIFELENENNLLKLNNQFQKEALDDYQLADFSQKCEHD